MVGFTWGETNERQLAVSLVNYFSIWLIVLLTGFLIWGFGLTTDTDASFPYIDSFVLMASLIFQWLVANKRLESWLFRIVADVVMIGLYAVKVLYITSGLYAVFLILAVTGYDTSRRDFANQREFIPDTIQR